ncbi:MAG: magnesium transporter, partial [Cyanothece sp. SIO2G6]|nr:magnesium transporter [Cyanothece sp. SIO2G6]
MTVNTDHDSTTTVPTIPRQELRELVRSQLQALLEDSNLKGAKALLVPVQPADIAEAIGGLPETMQVIAFRLIRKSEAIEVYEYLDSSIQQSLLEEFKRQEVLTVVDQMSPDDRAKLFDELPAKVVTRLLSQLSPDERRITALLLGYESDTAGRIMTPEYV